MGIDATRKGADEGFMREWPDALKMDEDVRKRGDSIWNELRLD